MARSRRKNGGPKRGTFRRKKLGKGWSTVRKETGANRPVLRITETADKKD
ncbi:MAG: hypothetical protein JNL08_21205 [Planctomycetes bacterium]|nr:hypothetical protein [Planctomycetota bacterium]